jgi:hypothetical protein
MIDTSLPYPNIGGKGHHLRRIAAQAISYIEINAANYTGAVGVAGRHPAADELKAFFDACSAAVTAYVQSAPVTGEVNS